MKLRKLHIENYKMFKNFDISFLDENDKALPIIILAGVNGSGKTTILECLNAEVVSDIDIQTNYNEINLALLTEEGNIGYQSIVDDYQDGLVVFPSGIDDIKDIADEFVKTFYLYLKEKDYRPSEVKEYFGKYMKDIFEGLDLTFDYSHLDKEDNVWFTNSSGEEFQIEQLSTGEKTLLSKILYIYFKDYQDKVILIDEPELSLHPSWQNKILSVYERLAEKNNCQIIIATHSPHIIGSAKNQYIRVLREVNGKIEVINDLKAYGRDIEWVLKQMGVENLRVSEVLEKFTKCQQLLNDENYDEAETCINDLEEEIGQNDRQIMNLRNSLFFERD